MQEKLVNLDLVLDACRLAIATPFVKGERPVSILLIAPPEHGKSTLLSQFSSCPSVYYTTDFTSFVLENFMNSYPKKRTIIIPDLLRITERRPGTSKNIISLVSSLIEDGWSGKLPYGRVVEEKVIANVLTSVTKTVFYDKRWWWAKMGFLTRFLPITYSYTDQTDNEIHEWIGARKYLFLSPIMDDLKETEVVFPPEFTPILTTYSRAVVNKLSQVLLTSPVTRRRHVFSFLPSGDDQMRGYRFHKSFQILAMASAILNGRTQVTEEDIDRVGKIIELINFDFTPL